jgi:uncharacterized membrane protein
VTGSDNACARLPSGTPAVWHLRRNCAISPRQFVVVYCSLVVVSLLVATFWTLLGAWPVLPFAGIDLVCVGAAFLVYARHATDYERVEISAGKVVIDAANGNQMLHVELNPRWVRVTLQDRPRPKIEIRCPEKTIVVGTHVPLHLRASIAREMRQCISRWD